jgi:histidinol-phosphate/aromatic aminotransferase/cobyric acid decarboxylase-like protein
LLELREENDFAIEVEQVLQDVEQQQIDALVIPNPNSPTGQRISRDDLLTILERGKRLKTVVIDESFIEFTSADRNGIPSLRADLDKYPQLIVMRSLGKDYGACGLRLGLMATSNRAVLDQIRRFLPVWNISPLAERFLRLCVQYRADYEKARLICIQETQLLVSRLSAIPKLKVFDTFSNFVLFKILDERVGSVELRDHLLNQFGFYVRDCSRKAGLGDKFIRVGTNLPAENARLVQAISDYLDRK